MRVANFTQNLLNCLKAEFGEDKVFFFNNDFAKEDSISACLKNSPVLFVDFLGDSISGQFQKVCTFEVYIIHATPSVNARNRETSFYAQMDFLEKLDNTLQELKFNHCGVIMPTKLVKEYSEMTKNGFLTIYKREFEVTLYTNPYEEGEE